MKYKLYYSNKWGQMSYPDGKTVNAKDDGDYVEEYTDMYEARDEAKKVLNKNPLMEAMILFDDMEIRLFADEPMLDKAQKEEWKRQETIGEKVFHEERRKRYIKYTLYLIVAVILYWL